MERLVTTLLHQLISGWESALDKAERPPWSVVRENALIKS